MLDHIEFDSLLYQLILIGQSWLLSDWFEIEKYLIVAGIYFLGFFQVRMLADTRAEFTKVSLYPAWITNNFL